MNFKQWLISEDVDVKGIMSSLPSFYQGHIPDNLMANTIYDALTENPPARKVVKDLLQDPAKYKQYNDAYKQTLQMINQHVSKLNWTYASNGAWVEWYRNGITDGVKSDDKTTKSYVSVDPQQTWEAIKSLPMLMRYLQNIQTAPESPMIGVKVPTNFGSFFQGIDNIVIHYYDKNATSQIEQAISKFQSDAGLNIVDRSKFGRLNTGKDIRGIDEYDPKGGSDSMLVARQVVRNLQANRKIIEPQMQSNPQQAMQIVKQIITQVSQNASHRA